MVDVIINNHPPASLDTISVENPEAFDYSYQHLEAVAAPIYAMLLQRQMEKRLDSGDAKLISREETKDIRMMALSHALCLIRDSRVMHAEAVATDATGAELN